MLLLDYKTGVAKQTYKTRFFATPFLREGKGRKEERVAEVKTPPFFTPKHFWALKKGEEVVPPFWDPKCQFFKSARTPCF